MSAPRVPVNEMRQLLDAVDAAYKKAREEVFDREQPGADTSHRTPRQQELVAQLERLEADLKRLRQRWARNVEH